jgi:hypothetical protein
MKFGRLCVLVLAAAVAIAVPAFAAPLHAGEQCKRANEMLYQQRGFVCVATTDGKHRLATIVAEPARHPARPRTLP